jgi:hypothetical protein
LKIRYSDLYYKWFKYILVGSLFVSPVRFLLHWPMVNWVDF